MRGRPTGPPRPTLLGAATRGLAAGVAGVAAMTAAQEIYYKVTGAQESSTPARASRKILHAVAGVEVPDRYESLLSWGTPVGGFRLGLEHDLARSGRDAL